MYFFFFGLGINYLTVPRSTITTTVGILPHGTTHLFVRVYLSNGVSLEERRSRRRRATCSARKNTRKEKGKCILPSGPSEGKAKWKEEAKIKGRIGKVLAGLGTGRIHRCAVCNRGSCNAITCWIPIHHVDQLSITPIIRPVRRNLILCA